MNLGSFITLTVLLFTSALGGCASPPDPSTPEGAFALISPCADRQDAKCLFHRLDRDSRWAVETMRKTFEKMTALVDTTYPEEEKSRAFGIWENEARAKTAEAFFEAYCAREKCLAWLADGFAPIVSVEKHGPDQVTVTTGLQKSFGMRRADNKWGLDRFRDDLINAKIRMLDRLAEVERNAKAYEEQKLAGGDKN